MIGRALCRLGLHYYGTVWANVASIPGGGPVWVHQRCLRCFHETMTRNLR